MSQKESPDRETGAKEKTYSVNVYRVADSAYKALWAELGS